MNRKQALVTMAALGAAGLWGQESRPASRCIGGVFGWNVAGLAGLENAGLGAETGGIAE